MVPGDKFALRLFLKFTFACSVPVVKVQCINMSRVKWSNKNRTSK